MAIQIPNPGTGNGASGDNEFVLWSKVKDNFSDQTNAAGRLVGTGAEQVPLSKNIPSLLGTAATKNVGTAAGNVMEVGAFGLGGGGFSVGLSDITSSYTGYGSVRNDVGLPYSGYGYGAFNIRSGAGGTMITVPYHHNTAIHVMGYHFVSYDYLGNILLVSKIYTNKNTTKDSNGFIKSASPIVKVHADKVVLNEEAEQQNVTFKKNGIGDYTITTESGLSTDGWYLELPKDLNGNPKVAVTLSEVDGVISLKSYKRIFSMETFTFEPDLDNPLDIPDTRWIDLRLNEVPIEFPDDNQTEEIVDLDK